MQGWVYVITNKSMPNIVKVGYSSKDPELRAKELNNTGSPHPYVVEYMMLINDPYHIEQKAHRLLNECLENKEWFRCTVEHAIAAIREAGKGRCITETYQKADRLMVEHIEQKQILDRQRQIYLDKKIITRENKIEISRQEIEKKYSKIILDKFPPRPFWNYWIFGAIATFPAITLFFPNISDEFSVLLFTVGSVGIRIILKNFFENDRINSSGYQTLMREKQNELEQVEILNMVEKLQEIKKNTGQNSKIKQKDTGRGLAEIRKYID